MVHARCGDLDVKIINNTPHQCVFKNKVSYYGTLSNDQIPPYLYAHQSSPIFTAHQDNIGVGILLTYICDHEIVKFYSWQDYSGFFGPGDVGGQPQDVTTLNLEYRTQSGNCLTGRPGKITWYIS